MKAVHSVIEVEGLEEMMESTGANVVLEYHPAWSTKRVYICPRNITIHRGNPGACGRLCKRAQGEAEDEYVDEEVIKALVIRKETIYNGQICVDRE